ncbi:winged helix DNA-binding domain-containing protein [Anaerolineales bacterium]
MFSSEIGNKRLFNQGLMGEQFQSPEEVVKHLGAIQAQDYKQSLWAIGSRMRSAKVEMIEASIEKVSILRTWAMRGTIHYLPAEDTQWMLDLCASKILSGSKKRMQDLGLNNSIISRCEQIFRDAFRGEKALSRAYLLQLLEEAGIGTEGQRGYHILWHLGHRGVIAIGPMLGTQQSFILLEDRVKNMRSFSREEALITLVDRYFKSHSPATEQDFARWSGLNLTETRQGIEGIKDQLYQKEIDSILYYFHQDSLLPSRGSEPVVKLLAAYDEFILGYKDRSMVLPVEHKDKIAPGNNGVFQPVVVVNGAVVGIWKRQIKARYINIDLHAFSHFKSFEDAIQAEAEQYGDFMGLPVRLTIQPPFND